MDYESLKIKSFDMWDLYLHVAQYPYLGRCYAAARREDAKSILDMNAEEKDELFDVVINSWNGAVYKSFGDFQLNLTFMGNTWKHLHAHMIPRFEGVKTFYGINFIDPNPKGNYSPYPKNDIQMELLLRIKNDIKNNL
jgi:diadenosine tetraphosphate (Ap4A) HIT family hydrolase